MPRSSSRSASARKRAPSATPTKSPASKAGTKKAKRANAPLNQSLFFRICVALHFAGACVAAVLMLSDPVAYQAGNEDMHRNLGGDDRTLPVDPVHIRFTGCAILVMGITCPLLLWFSQNTTEIKTILRLQLVWMSSGVVISFIGVGEGEMWLKGLGAMCLFHGGTYAYFLDKYYKGAQ